MLRFTFKKEPEHLCSSNCFSCRFRAPINFKRAHSIYKRFVSLTDSVIQYESLPWYKRLFKFHPDPEHKYIDTDRNRLLNKFHDLVLEFPCRLNPEVVIKGNLGICSHYEDRWPCGVYRVPMSMEGEIKSLSEYIEYMMEKEIDG